MRGPFKWLRGRSAPPAFIESRLERLSQYPPMPPPPPPVTPQAAPTAEFIPGTTPGSPPGLGGPARIKLILADGSESSLSADPDISARAAYLVKSMLPPRPPAPGEGSSGPRPV